MAIGATMTGATASSAGTVGVTVGGCSVGAAGTRAVVAGVSSAGATSTTGTGGMAVGAPSEGAVASASLSASAAGAAAGAAVLGSTSSTRAGFFRPTPIQKIFLMPSTKPCSSFFFWVPNPGGALAVRLFQNESFLSPPLDTLPSGLLRERLDNDLRKFLDLKHCQQCSRTGKGTIVLLGNCERGVGAALFAKILFHLGN